LSLPCDRGGEPWAGCLDASCIVTGAARGIGRAIGEALLCEGADVCFADINADKVAEVADRTASAEASGGR
jgi:meso-butanediol dehydrogenase/(S,S)-butanediol dehydrogenase/diacetyl reductase